MKNVFVFALVLIGLFSCQPSDFNNDQLDLDKEYELPEELRDLFGDIQTRNYWPKPSYDVAMFLTRDYKPDNYEGCQTELISAHYGPEEMEGSDGEPLSSIIADALYELSDMPPIIAELRSRASKECDDDYVIVEAEFYSYFDHEPYLSHLGAYVEICCDPIYGPTDPKDPKTPGPEQEELSDGMN